MKLLDAILKRNRTDRPLGSAPSLHVEELAGSLPLAVVACIDPRVNRFLPGAFGLPDTQVIWIRNAGGVVSNPLGDTMRSLAVACTLEGAREIVIVGHTDCRVALMDGFAHGARNDDDPDFVPSSDCPRIRIDERRVVASSVAVARRSPLIDTSIPVHGLLMNIVDGSLACLANGYERSLDTAGEAGDSSLSRESGEDVVKRQAPDGAVGVELIDQAKGWLARLKAEPGTTLKKTVLDVGRASAIGLRELAQLIDHHRTYHVIGIDDKEYGPIPGYKLVKWLMEDRITAETPVRPDGEGWQPLGKVLKEIAKRQVGVTPEMEAAAGKVARAVKEES
ncbi:MAG TPA: hypothetical protein DCY13_16940 [Verrucomicrobiales bacterium]|nr:hypothetical protein [Verrucomicrobiales bacterium]